MIHLIIRILSHNGTNHGMNACVEHDMGSVAKEPGKDVKIAIIGMLSSIPVMQMSDSRADHVAGSIVMHPVSPIVGGIVAGQRMM